ncbi:MAG: 4Fe-4S dicluster domain-containing protein [Campylobacter sp.]|nr:4Fe-4S dicluster domain-containing protein [Campylobacter sp.]
MKEFVFIQNLDDEVVLSDEIELLNKPCSSEFLVSNDENQKALIYAPEINFYLSKSLDDTIQKAKNSSLLYEARAVTFDGATDIDYEKEVGKNILLVSDDDKSELATTLKESGFSVITLTHSEINFIYGQVGELFADVLQHGKDFEVECDFFLVENAKPYMLRQSGCLEISELEPIEILDYLNNHFPLYHYKNSISYNSDICQYHHRRSEHCAKCVDICPTVAILKDDEKKELVFSHIDCVGCGGCVSICPSGALDYTKMPKDAFWEVAKMYENKIPLITPRIMDLDDCDVSLPKNVLPFAIEGEKFLSQTHLLTLLEESGANIIFYSDLISAGVKESIDLINQIYNLKFGVDAILVAKDEIELRIALKTAKLIHESKFSLANQANLAKREIFAKRVKFLVGGDDLGVAKSGEWIRYGKVEINESSCTLCLSCVGACNVGALIADTKDNSIKFNASICTTCGYCEVSCAEKDTIKLTRGELELKPEYFEYQTLAKDELFKCVECGKEFATTKAVQKIANFMEPKFKDDPYKLKSLYCCSDCKAKLMIKKQLEQGVKIF